jgi:excisionase family DNA binding protein
MQGIPDYLTTDEAARYLRLGERKLYELIAGGAVPCTKVTGKWLFARALLDRWLAAGMHLPEGLARPAPPPIVGGSHDPLLEWLLRESRCGLAIMPEGSEAGLARLAAGQVMAAAIHLHAPDGSDEEANGRAIRSDPALADVVLVAFCEREQGLLVAAGNPKGIAGIADLAGPGIRVAMRQKGAGAQLLLERLARLAGLDPGRIKAADAPSPTGADLALAIRAGRADAGLATRAVALSHGLGFVPLIWERFDLALRERDYFSEPIQAALALTRRPVFTEHAHDLGGYRLDDTGRAIRAR